MSLLSDTLDPANLRAAWDAVAENNGMPGVDCLSVGAWRRDWEANLVELTRRVRGGRYRPGRLREVTVPKKTPGQWRTLRIPTVADRVLQRAALQALMPIYERIFLDCSFGYRPNRGLKQALQCILRYRDDGRRWVLDADIDACFDSLDHGLLFDFLKADLPDDSLLGLVAAWLRPFARQSQSGGAPTTPPRGIPTAPPRGIPMGAPRGIPMGAPISPLLANLYLHRLDAALTARGRRIVRYADDFIVLTGRENRLDDIYAETQAVLERLKLAYEPSKTRLTSFDQGFTFIGVDFIGDQFTYACKDRTVQITGRDARWLLDRYLPEYA